MLPMMVVKSPRCDETVTLPAGLTPESKVRCPFTKEEFLVSEILDQLPPLLEVVDGPQPDASAGPYAALIGAPAAAVADTSERAEERSGGEGLFSGFGAAKGDEGDGESAPSFSLGGDDDEGGVATAATTETATKAKTRPAPRKKKAPKNAVVEIAKIVGGGVLGLFIAMMIIWWGMRTDPLELAPSLPGFLRFLAPAHLRDGTGGDDKKGDDPAAANEKDTKSKPSGAPRGNPQNHRTGGGTSNRSPQTIPNRRDSGPAGDSGDSGIADAFRQNLEKANKPKPSSPSFTGPDSGPNGKLFSARELGEALEVAATRNMAYDNSAALPQDARLPIMQDFYRSLATLGHRITFVDVTDKQAPSRRDAIAVMLREFANDPSKLAVIGKAAPGWISNPDRRPGNRGVVLAGAVAAVQREEPLFRTDIQLTGSDATVSVYSKKDPLDFYSMGDRLVMLGAIIEEPARNLPGYKGKAERVVFGGLPVKLPKE